MHRKTNKSTYQLVPGELHCLIFKDIASKYLIGIYVDVWHHLTLSSTIFRHIYASVVSVLPCEKDV